VGKAIAKRSSRKVLANKTNAATAPIKAKEDIMSLCFQLQPFQQQPATSVVVQGEDLLCSLVHSNLTIIQTPNGSVRQSPKTKMPQIGVPTAFSPDHDTTEECKEDPLEEVILSLLEYHWHHHDQNVDARPPVEDSPSREVTASMLESLSSTWMGCDVDEVLEVGEDNDLDYSMLVNMSSPGMNLVASLVSATSIRSSTTRLGDFKWQQRNQFSLKVKKQENARFSYYGGHEGYEGCIRFDREEDYNGEVINCK
jgi:hypothetical protein